MTAYIPETLDLALFNPKYMDRYIFFISTLYISKVLNKSYEKHSFINIKAAIMRDIIGLRTYPEIVQTLITKNIIECDNNYVIGIKSKGYRLTDKYINVKHRAVLITDKRIINKINYHKSQLLNSIPGDIEYKKLFSFLNDIEINYSAAKDFIYSEFENDVERFNSYNISIDKIYNKDFFFIPDRVSGRLHTNITNLSRHLRQFLSYKNIPLVNIDICNSQPFLFNTLISKYYNSQKIQSTNAMNMHNLYTGIEKPVNWVSTKTPLDVSKFESLTQKGIFYDYLMEKLKYSGNRQDFKKHFFGTIFYSRNESEYDEKQFFKNNFPNVSDIIYHYKKDNHKALPIALQKSEREIIINRIARNIVIQKPSLFITTIHDSIMTTQGNESYVSKMVSNEFKGSFELQPKVKYEFYN